MPLTMNLKPFYVHELAKREASNGVTVHIFHPGVAASKGTKEMNDSAPIDYTGLCSQPIAWFGCMCVNDSLQVDMSLCPLSVEHGSVTPTFLASAPDSLVATHSGHYTVACERQTHVHISQRIRMISRIGEPATEVYGKAIFDLLIGMAAGKDVSQEPEIQVRR